MATPSHSRLETLAVSPCDDSPCGAGNKENINEKGKANTEAHKQIWGATPEELVDGLMGAVSGCMLDAADALEVSTRQRGVPAQSVTPAINAMVEAIREQIRRHLPVLREYATRNVFALPSGMCIEELKGIPLADNAAFKRDERQLDRQISNSTQRLRHAQVNVNQLEKAQRDLQCQITELEDIYAKIANSDVTQLESSITELMDAIAATERDLKVCQASLQEQGLGSSPATKLTGTKQSIAISQPGRELTQLEKLKQQLSDVSTQPSLLPDSHNSNPMSSEQIVAGLDRLQTRLRGLHQ